MNVSRMPFFLAGSCLLGAHAALAQGKAWLVDDDLGHGVPDFAQIQPAVDAAADGDLIVIGSGLYGGFTVDGKSLTIAAFPGELVALPSPDIAIKNLAATKAVTLRGLGGASAQPHVTASSNVGNVYIESCELSNCTLVDCASVSLQRTKVHFSTWLARSTLHAFESTFWPASAKSGLTAMDHSFAFLSGCAVSGAGGSTASAEWQCICLTTFGPCDGSCGDPYPFISCSSGESPKPAFQLGAESHAISLDSSFTGGTGGSGCGFGGIPTPYPPAFGVAFDATSDVEYLGGESHQFVVSSVALEGTTIDLRAKGGAGEHMFLVLSAALAPTYYGALNGPLLVGQPWIVMFLGALPANGLLSLPVQLSPNTVSGASFTQILAQALFVHPSQQGPDYLGSASTLIVLDTAWHP